MDNKGRRHAHEHQHAKKDVIVTVIDTVYAEATAQPEVIVWVDPNGVPLSTMTEGLLEYPPSIWSTAPGSTILPATPEPAATTSTSVAPAPAAVDNVEVVAPAPASTTPVVVVPAAPSPDPVATSVAAPVHTTTSSVASSGYGISYSPYNADSSCKTQNQVNQDIAAIASGYGLIRIYGTDCNQVQTTLTAARANQKSIMIGIFDLSDVSGEVEIIIEAAAGNWANIDLINIGNELVNNGVASPAAILAAVASAQAQLEAAGYTGPVVTVDTLVATKANPSLCNGFAKCYVNCHPFFDGNTVAADAGTFLETSISQLQAALADSSQEIIITETGWPWQGTPNGVAVPSPANQDSAVSAITTTFAGNPAGVIILSAFNDVWKAPGSFNVEQFWGVGQAYSPSG
jgi:exo-beta-1,3-glucanase (GH17 family)